MRPVLSALEYDDDYADYRNPATPLEVAMPFAIAHQLRDALSQRNLRATTDVSGVDTPICDTFGPDPGTDSSFRESSLVFHRHRIDLENLTNVGALPPRGAWIIVGGPRNANGSGSPATIYGMVP